MTDAAEQAEWDSDNGSYLAGLKGVTIPGTAPSLNESHKRGRHGSSEDALRANASDMMGIFESLNGKPAVQMTVESIVPAKPAPKAEGDDAENAENADNANQTARGNEDEHRKANGATAASPAAAQHQPTPRQSTPSQVDATAHGDGNKRHTKPWFSKPAPSTPVQRPAPFPEAQKPSMTPVEDYYTMPENTFEEQQDEPLTARMPELDPEFTRDTGTTPKIPLNSIPSPLPVTDFVVPETTGSDNDAIPPQRLEKARLVEETLRAEHPDADDEFVAAIRQLVELNASDLHLAINDPPMLRVDGKLQPAKDLSVWNKDHTFAAVQTMTNDLELERFKDDLELDISFSIGDLLRFRVNVYRDRLGVCAALRTIPTEIKTAKQLDLDPRIADLAMLPRGLVLVCGPTGSGKSTTLAAIVDKANAERADHIITIEDPIEFVHQHKRCVMSQREVGTDTKSFAEALKRALREDPDIIEVGELRDLETISTALTAVETGHLVFATLHTQDAGSTVDRLIDVYPENQQQQIRVQVASTLRAVVVQTLLPRASGHGRVPATEVMLNTPAVAALIRGGKAHQIRTVLQSGEKEGMHTLDQDLARLVNKGTVKYEDALAKVQVLEEFEKMAGARSVF